MNKNILLVPMGPVPEDLLVWLERGLNASYGRPVIVLAPIELPESAYNPDRSQYHGEKLIAALRSHSFTGAERVLGLVDADCYSPGLNFIFGQATVGGRNAFVALPRLRETYYGRPQNTALFRQRVMKEILHELGHTWGLAHCPDPHCVMHFSNTLEDTDTKSADLCARCREKYPG